MRQLFLILLGLILLVGCASQAAFGDPIIEGEPTPIPTPIIPTKPEYQVERGNVIYRMQFTGRVEPIVNHELQFSIDGRVRETFFEAGDDVQAGDLIAVLDAGLLEVQRLEAQANLEAAQSLLESVQRENTFEGRRAQLNFDLAQLRLDHAIAQAGDAPSADDSFAIRSLEIERDLAQLEVDKLDDTIDPDLQLAIRRAENALDEIEADIEDTRLIAPIAGRLMFLRFPPGNEISAFQTVGSIADLSQLEVQDTASASELNEMAEGMPVQMHLASQPDEGMSGMLVALPRPYGSGPDDAVHIQFDDQAQAADLNVGDRITVSVLIDQRDDVLWLPIAAIRQFSGRDFVVVQTGGIQQRVDVELGLEGDGRVEILEGLETGQTVIGA